MPAIDSLLLEVYDLDGVSLLWEVSSSPDHAQPYLIGPDNYGEQELDPISGSASIGTAEVGIVDAHQVPGDQATGWLTQRVSAIHGRRCRLRRWAGDVLGWHLITDGPAGAPRLDESYAAYRFAIRDARETERKLRAFITGGTSAIFPRGPLENWGALPDDEWLLEAVVPIPATMKQGMITDTILQGWLEFDDAFTAYPEADPDYVVGTDVEAALAGMADGADGYFPNADVLWRLAGSSDPWNVVRPVVPANYIPSLALGILDDGQITPADPEADIQAVRVIRGAQMFWAADGVAPAGMPADGTALEVIIRYRGPASEDFPFYWQGTSGELLAAAYSGALALPPGLAGGTLYDPAGLEATLALLAATVPFDAAAVAQLTDEVLLREEEPVDDFRDWAEAKIYGPSGWIAALDGEGQISPVSRARPSSVDGPLISNANAEPAPDWNAGELIVTSVSITYPRYFRPANPLLVQTMADGLAKRDVTLVFRDAAAEALHTEKAQDYDGSAFGAAGDGTGAAVDGVLEAGAFLAEMARFEVLARYREGAPAFRVAVRRATVPDVRAGDWLPADLSWLPHYATGLRGGAIEAAQVLAIRESSSAWREMLLEISDVYAAPGMITGPVVIFDEYSAGYLESLVVLTDEEAGS